MADCIGYTNRELRSKLTAFVTQNPDHWSFRSAPCNRGQSLFKYPAMMVPSMLAQLLDVFLSTEAGVTSIYEPFVGSGTVMAECMKRGVDFTGQDINPLAVLLCKVRRGPFYLDALAERSEIISSRILDDRKCQISVDFEGLAKWFRRDVACALSRVVRCIRRENSLWSRRFFWVALAETVRLCSNARTTSFKLHARKTQETASRHLDPVEIFQCIVRRNLNNLGDHAALLKENDLLRRGHYSGKVKIRLSDSSRLSNQMKRKSAQHELLISSPPYGDNKSTVAYGQFSYLPLRWIDLDDIQIGLDKDNIIGTAYEIDHRSLGGNVACAESDIRDLLAISPSFRKTLANLRGQPPDRWHRVASFWRDLNKCFIPILEELKPNACLIWVVGNRTVGGYKVPMDEIFCQLFRPHHVRLISSFNRTIPRKQLAAKNNISMTMGSEKILIMRRER
jgi:hypothetical protein